MIIMTYNHNYDITIIFHDDHHDLHIIIVLLLVPDHLLKSLSNHLHCDKLKFHLQEIFMIIKFYLEMVEISPS